MRLQSIPDIDGDVLGRRNDAVEWSHHAIQEAVIVDLHHFAIQSLLQRFQIEYHTRDRVRRAFHRNFQNVVVTVSMRISRRAKQRTIFRLRKLWVAANVGRGELHLAGDQHGTYLYECSKLFESTLKL